MIRSILSIRFGVIMPGLMLLTLFAQAQPIPRAAADSLSRLLLTTTTQIDTNRINLLLRLGAYYLYKPLELETDLDSARQCARQAEALSRILHFPKGLTHSLELLGNISMEAHEIAKAKVYYQAQLHSARGANDVRGVAQACLLLARTYMVSRRDSLVQMNLVRRALQLYQRVKDKDKEAETWRTLADFHQLYGNYPQALYELNQSLKLEETPPVGSPYYTYDLMAHVQQQLGNYGEAVRYSLESIRKAQALGDTSQIQTFYLRLGWLYYDLNEWDEGIVYMKKLMSIHQKRNQVGGVIATAEVITDGLIHQKKYPEALEYVKRTLQQIKTLEALQPPNPVSQVAFARMLARVYFHNGQYGEAEKYYTQYFQRLNQKITYPEEWAQAYADAGTFYVSTRNYPRAKDYLDKAMAIRQQLGNKTFVQIRNIYYQYFRLDSLQGNCKSALAHYQQYKILNDSIFNQTQGRQLANLRVQFDIRKKEQDLYLKDRNIQLLTKQTQLQQAHIRHSQSLRNMTLSGLALLLVLLGVIYNRYRLKQRSNQLLQTQQAVLQAQRLEIEQKNEHLSALLKQKERLLREIHHRVKNNLQVIMSLLNSQANFLQDHAALAAIRESQHRVHAMALIHQKLYQAEGVACISMPSYIGEVVAYLTEFYTLSSPVCFKLQVEEIELDVTQAVPLGLVINEALTNALKYAFPEGRAGTVKVGLIRSAQSVYRLTIADDGVGLSAGFDPATSRTLGMTLMQGLSEQLGGRLTISSRSGLTIALLFGGQQPGSANMDLACND